MELIEQALERTLTILTSKPLVHTVIALTALLLCGWLFLVVVFDAPGPLSPLGAIIGLFLGNLAGFATNIWLTKLALRYLRAR